MAALKRIKVGKKYLLGLAMKLGQKNLVVVAGARGYVMCGYLNLSAANKFKDTAVKVTGVATVADALKGHVHSCTREALKKGIRPGQRVRDILKQIT
jgi:uncharacterized protein YunC (DUF1805 family)